MAWTEAQILTRVSTALNDTATAIWSTVTIAAQLELDVLLMSDYVPQLAKGTVAFAGTVRELSIATLTDLLEVEEVEFPIDKHPVQYVNFSKRGSSVILDDYNPAVSTADTAYIWYTAPHTVSGSINTLDRQEEHILIELTAAHLLQNIARDRREGLSIAGGDLDTKYLSDGNRREQIVMARLRSHVKPNFNIRYPDEK